jgi:16S rRNA (guanine1516-N2)-methyltransferase
MIQSVVTTSQRATNAVIEQARQWAIAIGGQFVLRDKRSVPDLLSTYDIPAILIYSGAGPSLVTAQGRHDFHLSMAELRIQHLRRGQTDHLLEALGATGPVRLLDCTCGFGADSVVASFGLPQGSVIDALESSPLLAAVTQWGLGHFVHGQSDVTAALRRIHLQCHDYEAYLADAAAPAYDILYFDPMFSHPVWDSPQFLPVRPIMDHHILTMSSIRLARQKARCRVVIKGRRFRELTASFPDVRIYGGTYSRIRYAVLDGWAQQGQTRY